MSNAITGMMAANRRKGGGGFQAETLTWNSRVDAASGTYESDSKSIADDFIIALNAKSYQAKVVYVLPLLGANLAAARVPLRDSLAVGIATNHSFTNGDFSQATGLQGDGSTKYLDSLIKPSQLGSSSNGGYGYWENNINLTGNVEPIGCYNTAGTNRFVLFLTPTFQGVTWGNPALPAYVTLAPTNADYYGQHTSSTLKTMYRDGSSIATNTTSDSPSGANEQNIFIVGGNESGTPFPWPGRCACAYMTDGTLSDADVADLHTLIGTYIITATGR